ncbi:MAG: hypothetical protein EA397_00420 [Deltaproteobacteria bacterium]|nr:MAG: hypothetical protein EA397_00420 [Deltaproteobacteria bacterium]
MRSAWIALLIACSNPAPEPPEVRAAGLRLDVALDRLIEAHSEGKAGAALEAWRDAHEVWDARIGPGLTGRIDERELVALELHFARMRAAIEGGAGDPSREVEALRQGLASPLSSLP